MSVLLGIGVLGMLYVIGLGALTVFNVLTSNDAYDVCGTDEPDE
jgi:hypothetical protein